LARISLPGPLAIFDNASMWMAVFAEVGASLRVVASDLGLLNQARAPG
jgi:Zn2+/Cd2+-exporting ATPase